MTLYPEFMGRLVCSIILNARVSITVNLSTEVLECSEI